MRDGTFNFQMGRGGGDDEVGAWQISDPTSSTSIGGIDCSPRLLVITAQDLWCPPAYKSKEGSSGAEGISVEVCLVSVKCAA
jgi:hypothetical protein